MRVTLCGTGVGRFEGTRAGAGIYLHGFDGGILFDCGPGVPLRVMDAGIDLRSIRAVFVTHLHFDHVQGIAELLIQLAAIDAPFPEVYGPPGVAEYLHAATSWAHRQFENRTFKITADVIVHEIEPGTVHDVEGFTITSAAVFHGDNITAYGYRTSDGEKVLVYSGDTRPVPEVLVPFAQNADILIHEAYSEEAIEFFAAGTTPERAGRVRTGFPKTHTVVTEAARIAASANVRTLVLTHLIATEEATNLKTAAEREFRGTIVVPTDGLTLDA